MAGTIAKEIEELIKIISKLPGLGPKSAKRIVLKLINNREELIKPLANTLAQVYKNIIKEIISSEDEKKPLTDDEIVKTLPHKNVKIARRTITKYRKELNIPSASKRKRIF